MNIVFDNVIFSKERQGGISNYWFELIKDFAGNTEVSFYEEERATENIFRRQLDLQNLIPHFDLPLPLARLLPIRYNIKTEGLLYHSSFYRRLFTRSLVCEITTVHDFTHNKHAAPLNRILHNYLKYGSIKRSKGIICISNNTYRDLNKYCRPRKDQKSTVIYNGVSNDYRRLTQEDECHLSLLNKFNLEGKFLLFVGARTHYKNFPFALKLLEQLTEYKLVVIGNELSKSELSTIDGKLLNRIVVARAISNTDLNILYNYAEALLYPSSYEGFGIPVIEAMKAGCPVLALNTSSIPEVAGVAGILFDDLSLSAFIKAIRRLQDDSYRKEILFAGFENSKKFDWEKSCRETRQFYEEVYNGVF